MTDRDTRPNTLTDPELARVLEEIHDKLTAGGSIDLDAYISELPEHENAIRTCWGTIRAMAAFGETGDSATPGRSGVKQIGEFSVIREVGRGGMGVVYEARQETLGRNIALKVFPYAALLEDRQLKRFQNEARAAATLHHPNIVPIHSVGADKGVHYYAMQFIDGPSLAEVILKLRNDDQRPNGRHQSGPLGNPSQETLADLQAAISTERTDSRESFFRSVARWTKQAAEALQYAHDNGVLHRDIKPANLLIDARNNVWITDFGLARLESDVSLTKTGEMIGTLRYMAPEQVAGGSTLLDHRADVYSLGLTMYELLTLRPAFESENREQLFRDIANNEPTPVRRIDDSVPVELETILRKATEKYPADRYGTAQEFADDLQRLLDHKPIQARRPTWLRRSQKWCFRHRTAVTATVTTLVVTLLASLLILWQANQRIAAKNLELQQAQQESQQSVNLAVNAVDEMYSNFAKEWLSQQHGLTQEQKSFLLKAASLYEQIYSRRPQDLALIKRAAKAQWDAADMYGELADTTSRRRCLEKAREMLEPLLSSLPKDREAIAWDSLLAAYQLESMPRSNEADKFAWQTSYATAAKTCNELERLTDDFPDDGELLGHLSRMQYVMSYCSDDRETKLKYARSSVNSAKRVLDVSSESETTLRALANYLVHLANIAKGAERDNLQIRLRGVAERLYDNWPKRQNSHLLAKSLSTEAVRQRLVGNLQLAEELLTKSIEVCSHLTSSYPDIPIYVDLLGKSHHILSKVHRDAGRFQNEGEHLRRSIDVARQLDPGNYDAFFRSLELAKCLGRQGDKERGLELLREATEMAEERNSNQARWDIARTKIELCRQNRVFSSSEIKRFMLEALDTESSAWRSPYNRFQWHYDMEKSRNGYEEYLEGARKELPRHADDVDLLNSISGILTKSPFRDGSDSDEALRLIEKTYQLDPTRELVWMDYGWALYRQEKFEQAQEWFQKTEESGFLRKNSLAAFGLALTELKIGTSDSAREYVEVGLNLLEPRGALNREEVAILEEVAMAFGKEDVVAELLADRWPYINGQ